MFPIAFFTFDCCSFISLVTNALDCLLDIKLVFPVKKNFIRIFASTKIWIIFLLGYLSLFSEGLFLLFILFIYFLATLRHTKFPG